MKTLLHLLILGTLFALTPAYSATVTGRDAKTSLAGTEELPINDAGVDKKVTVANLLLTPQGAITATSVNGLTITTTTGTLTVANGKTVTANNTLTFAGTDGTTMTFPSTSQTLVGLTSTATLTNKTLTAPILTTPTLGVASATTVNKITLTAPATGATLTLTDGKTLAVTNSLTLAGTDSTTFTFPPTTATVFTSTLSSNDVGAANGIWGASNALVFEGSSADTSEISLTPANATADVVYLLPDAAAASYAIMSSTLATNAPNIANSVTGASNSLIFEGTADAHEISITPADATADVVYILPNAAAASYAVMSSTLATNAPDVANSVTGASNSLIFEGTADAFETSVTATDPTADRTVTLANASGTVALSQSSTAVALAGDNQAVTPGAASVIQLSSDNATATSRTFTLSATGAITGQTYIILAPATNGCEIAATGIQKLSATWSPTALDTLTLLFDGTNFLELARSAN